MTFKVFRRGSARCIGLLSVFVTILLCLYYISIGQPSNSTLPKEQHHAQRLIDGSYPALNSSWQNWLESSLSIIKRTDKEGGISNAENNLGVGVGNDDTVNSDSNSDSDSDSDSADDEKSFLSPNDNWQKCSALAEARTSIDTVTEFGKFDFQPEWMKTKEYWDKTFEARFDALVKDPKRPPLKVVVVPHSHNDPGWLKTFVNYFQSDTRQILNLIVTKMQKYTDMTFIWSEISFLQMWWDQAHPTKQRALKHLVQSGRFEITTGGWVMTDEANVHIYAMLDQLIEGHQWVKTNLNVTPSVGWSIDPFGHGSTVPYLLADSDFEGTIIQRIHYAWKQWFGKNQFGDFIWTPYWSNRDNSIQTNINNNHNHNHKNPIHSILTHNMPFDIYSIKHSCGPHPFICLNFDFRKIPGEYTEYSIKAQFITDENVAAKAELLLEQYARTASLFPHNVAMIPVGDDFRYNKEREVDQQYTNYKKLIDYINNHRDIYKTEISFGTPKDYFRAIRNRYDEFPLLKGDFFDYSDIFTEGRPAYWTGYFTTRPSYKILSRDLEHNLRSLEILFTIAFNIARQRSNVNALRIYEKNYEKLILARRNLGLFQHHDAITGTSKSIVMRDYGIRLFESIQDCVKLQESTIEQLIQTPETNDHNFVLSELERESFTRIPKKTLLTLTKERPVDFVVFNSLAQERYEVVTVRTVTHNVKVFDPHGNEMEIQINPVWNVTESLEAGANNMYVTTTSHKIRVSDREFEVMFIAKLKPLALTTFTLAWHDSEPKKNKMATLYCDECINEQHNVFEVRNKQPGDIQLENTKLRLLFDERTGFLKTVTKKNMGRPIQCAIKFAAYRSAQFHSGAYLFKTDPEHRDAEKDVLDQYPDLKILITSGPIASDVTTVYSSFMAHTVQIYNTKTPLSSAIYIENDIDFEPPPKNRETEMFMRFVTDIENGEPPEFYGDLNGFQYQKRKKVPSIGIEGNYYPITTAAFIQDDKMRMTLLTTHAQGAASLEPGCLEVMLDRRTLYDDYRGMGEGIVDSRLTRHRFWLLLESFEMGDDGPAPADPVNVSEKERTHSGDSSNAEDRSSSTDNLYQLPSYLATQLSNSLNYPSNIYFIESSGDESTKLNLARDVSLLHKQFPCDVHLMSLRTLTEQQMPLFPSRSALLIIQRQAFDCRVGGDDHRQQQQQESCHLVERFSNRLFKGAKVEKILRTSLTGVHPKDEVTHFSSVYVEPMDIETFNFTFLL